MRSKVEETEQEPERLQDAHRASWQERKGTVDRAMQDLREGQQKAAAEF